jgi:NAD(P)-dependent dehydrogenase (short-subunit alcohol dehydrogenase family)
MTKWFSMAGRRALVIEASLSIGCSIALGFADHGAAVGLHYFATADKAFGRPDAAQRTVRCRESHADRKSHEVPTGYRRPGWRRARREASRRDLAR